MLCYVKIVTDNIIHELSFLLISMSIFTSVSLFICCDYIGLAPQIAHAEASSAAAASATGNSYCTSHCCNIYIFISYKNCLCNILVVESPNRIHRIVQTLQEKCHINRPDSAVISRIAKNERLLDLAVINTAYTYEVYENVKNLAGTETKSFIGEVLDMRVNGNVFEDFPFVLSAKRDTEAKLIKILRVADGASKLASRLEDLQFEILACRFSHEAIVPMEHHRIDIDVTIAAKANCRVGENHVLVMPWYTATLNKFPSNDFKWIAAEGHRIFNALEYLHNEHKFVHLDVKAMNIFVSNDCHWYLGDFGSCKPFGKRITSSTFMFCYENNLMQVAHSKYDWYMFLVLILIETLQDRRDHVRAFYLEDEPRWTNFNLVIAYARNCQDHPVLKPLIDAILSKLDVLVSIA
jgi:serine/threonine protein kinase